MDAFEIPVTCHPYFQALGATSHIEPSAIYPLISGDIGPQQYTHVMTFIASASVQNETTATNLTTREVTRGWEYLVNWAGVSLADNEVIRGRQRPVSCHAARGQSLTPVADNSDKLSHPTESITRLYYNAGEILLLLCRTV
ncbi:hypothetical protein J6590_023721 [Homalodisca vitripennis]|nr:hypothetical protein J6590_023721 [Homalodisca vitripennis]